MRGSFYEETPHKYAEDWEGSLEDMVEHVAGSDARYSARDPETGAVVRINIDGLEGATSKDEPIYIEYGETLFDAYNRKEAVQILKNLRRGRREFADAFNEEDRKEMYQRRYTTKKKAGSRKKSDSGLGTSR